MWSVYSVLMFDQPCMSAVGAIGSDPTPFVVPSPGRNRSHTLCVVIQFSVVTIVNMYWLCVTQMIYTWPCWQWGSLLSFVSKCFASLRAVHLSSGKWSTRWKVANNLWNNKSSVLVKLFLCTMLVKHYWTSLLWVAVFNWTFYALCMYDITPCTHTRPAVGQCHPTTFWYTHLCCLVVALEEQEREIWKESLKLTYFTTYNKWMYASWP